MSITRPQPEFEAWLNEQAADWQILDDLSYKRLVNEFRELYQHTPNPSRVRKGDKAVAELTSRLNEGAYVFGGFSIPEMANTGSSGPCAYKIIRLSGLPRDILNRLELIVLSINKSWCCLFSHECGTLVHEEFRELEHFA